MFLAELAYNTVQTEIKELELKKERRNNALEQSNLELDGDHIDLMKFIQKDEENKKTKEKQEKDAARELHEREERAKRLDSEIVSVKA